MSLFFRIFAPVIVPILSGVWATINGIRAVAHHIGWIRSEKVEPLVISVGNLQAGGAGKTPVVGWIARQFIAQGFHVAILLRGYGGNREREGGVIAPHESGDHAAFGDEAQLLARLVSDAWIGVGADRKRSLAEILSREKIDIVILDDGFQNYQIEADLKLLLLSTENSLRIYREFPWRARSADLILWTKGEKAPYNYSRPLCRLLLEPDSLPLQALSRIHLVCGIADPTSLLRLLGDRLVEKNLFMDHHPYSAQEISRFQNAAEKSNSTLVTTGKDWVKIQPFVNEADRGKWRVLEPDVKVIWGAEVWEKVSNDITFILEKRRMQKSGTNSPV